MLSNDCHSYLCNEQGIKHIYKEITKIKSLYENQLLSGGNHVQLHDNEERVAESGERVLEVRVRAFPSKGVTSCVRKCFPRR